MKKTGTSLLMLLFVLNVIACNNTQSNNNFTTDNSTLKTKKVATISILNYYFLGIVNAVSYPLSQKEE